MKKLNYLEMIDYHFSYGQDCRKCNYRGCKMFAVSDLNQFTMVTFKCTRCGNLQDTTYNTNHYKEAMKKLGNR
jgi:hypothetical protein